LPAGVGRRAKHAQVKCLILSNGWWLPNRDARPTLTTARAELIL
jgi:hypothetical protein